MIEFKTLANGFEYIEVQNSAASAKIALQGAHLFEYKRPNKEDILWLSSVARFEEKFPIRGGIPICWPWFGPNKENPTLPQHGFARISVFTLYAHEEIDEKTTQLTFLLTDSLESKKLWPFSFELYVRFHISDTLHVSVETLNKDTKSFVLSQALHTYFQVDDITQVSLLGLKNTRYYDQLNSSYTLQKGTVFFDKEVDRIYLSAKDLIMETKSKKIVLQNSGSNSLVVWNPWIEKTKNIVDMADDAYKKMLCVETANALDDTQTIQPGIRHTLSMQVLEE